MMQLVRVAVSDVLNILWNCRGKNKIDRKLIWCQINGHERYIYQLISIEDIGYSDAFGICWLTRNTNYCAVIYRKVCDSIQGLSYGRKWLTVNQWSKSAGIFTIFRENGFDWSWFAITNLYFGQCFRFNFHHISIFLGWCLRSTFQSEAWTTYTQFRTARTKCVIKLFKSEKKQWIITHLILLSGAMTILHIPLEQFSQMRN